MNARLHHPGAPVVTATLAVAMLSVLTLHALSAVGQIPPVPADILNAAGGVVGKAQIYPNYVELHDAQGRKKGAIGVVRHEGKVRLFLVNSAEGRTLVGWGSDHQLFDSKGELVGYYRWTPIWSYVYDKAQKKIGQAQCIAYQGVCAAAIAGYLLGLL